MAAQAQRRLAAIVSADVAGYSRLMGRDERGTLAALKAHRAELIDALVASHGGHIVKTTGDGMLVEFPSVVSAVDCCVAVQDGMALRNADIAADDAIRFRIGIHLGDVIVEDDDIFGDGVNIAARLQEAAEPGGIAVSAIVYDYLDGETARGFMDLGERELKNIRRPIRIWQRSGNGAISPPTTLALPDKPSIAVLPFDNMSGDPEQEYFSDGISEDIITALSKLHWLFVIARNSTFSYKGAAVDVTRIARELGVRYVVEGSVRKAANKVRITAQLIEGSTGVHVWADRYDRELDDIFALQDEITESIVGRIDSEVRASERERAQKKPQVNLDAWDFYQRGAWHLYKVSKEDNATARSLYRQSIEREPNFAAAHAGVALTCMLDAFLGYSDNVAESLEQGLAAGETAVALDDKDGFAHYALGRVLALTGQGQRAISEFERSIALSPSFAHGYYGLALTLNWYGRAEEGIPLLDMAMRLSPQDPLTWAMQSARAACCNNAGKYDEGVEWARKAIHARPNQPWPRIVMADALAALDRLDEARAAVAEARRLKPDLSLATIGYLAPNFHAPYDERLTRNLAKAGLPE